MDLSAEVQIREKFVIARFFSANMKYTTNCKFKLENYPEFSCIKLSKYKKKNNVITYAGAITLLMLSQNYKEPQTNKITKNREVNQKVYGFRIEKS